jgi:glycerate kinase
VTGEGRLDAQSLRGKAVGTVLERAARARIEAVVVCGEALVHPPGVAVRSLVDRVGRTAATEQPRRALEDAAADVADEIGTLSSGT